MLALIRKYLDWLDHEGRDNWDAMSSGLFGYWQSDLRAERCAKYGWE